MAETGKNTVNKNRLVPITVRFTVGAIEAIGDVAHKHSMTKAEIVRLAVDGRLSTYLGNLVYVDNKKADAIHKEISELGTKLEKIRFELNRIGVNYNQEMKLKNIEKKYSKRTDYESLKHKEKELEKVKSETVSLSQNDLDEIMTKYENALSGAIDTLGVLLK